MTFSSLLADLEPNFRLATYYLKKGVLPFVNLVYPVLTDAADRFDKLVRDFRPWQLVVLAVTAAWLLSYVLQSGAEAFEYLRQQGVNQVLFRWFSRLPFVSGYIEAQKTEAFSKLTKSVQDAAPGEEAVVELPGKGLPAAALTARLQAKERKCVQVADGMSTLSGVVYVAGQEHRELLKTAYALFDLSNPMHSSVYPSVRRMEAEVIAMTASILGGGVNGDPNVCGAMTSGGSESILSAMKASRDYMRAKHGIRHPEMIIAVSAHAAYYKAAEYFNIKLVRVPVGKDYRLSAKTVSRCLTRNTVVVVASAPGYPHGVVDHIKEIAEVTRRRGVLLHVDACLGGYVLPFARKLGYRVPPFDFSVPGVTSLSVDTHKFGMAHKGTSVVLYRSADLRKHQYTRITDWSGGLYISPGFAGSRNGGVIATAWASLMHLGEAGFLAATEKIMKATTRFIAALQSIPELELVGDPEMCVVAFKSTRRDFDMHKLNDLMTQRGWHLSALQYPPALHMCFTAAHADVVDQLVKDLQECCKRLSQDPACVKDGSAALYGMSAQIPDRRLVGEFLEVYQNALLSV